MPLIPVTTGRPSAVATRIPDLEVAGVGGLVAEQDQVERPAVGLLASRIASVIAPAVA